MRGQVLGSLNRHLSAMPNDTENLQHRPLITLAVAVLMDCQVTYTLEQ